MITFFAAGNPRPQGSTKTFVVNGRARTTTATKGLYPWRSTIAYAARCAGVTCLDGPIELVLAFRLIRPVSHRCKGGVRRSAPSHPWVPDLDKLTRACLDALSGVAYGDDSRVVSIRCTKSYADPGEFAGVQVTISAVAAAESQQQELVA